jgi:hypothetical protein
MFTCPIPNCYSLASTPECIPVVSYIDSCFSYEDPPISLPILEPIMLAPRFYIEVSTKGEASFIYKIDKYGLLSNYIQLLLKPNKEYKVKYFQWKKVISTSINTSSLTKILIKEEIWKIPSSYLLLQSLSLIRKDDDSSSCIDDFDVIDNPFILNPTINIEPKYKGNLIYKTLNLPICTYTNERVVSSIGIGWSNAPKPGTKYSISYYQPLDIKQVITNTNHIDLTNIYT